MATPEHDYSADLMVRSIIDHFNEDPDYYRDTLEEKGVDLTDPVKVGYAIVRLMEISAKRLLDLSGGDVLLDWLERTFRETLCEEDGALRAIGEAAMKEFARHR